MAPETLSHLESETREQGDVLAARTGPGWEHAAAAAGVLRAGRRRLSSRRGARAPRTTRPATRSICSDSCARLPVAPRGAVAVLGSDAPPLLSRGAVMAISQSGRSPDIIGVARRRPGAEPTDGRDHERPGLAAGRRGRRRRAAARRRGALCGGDQDLSRLAARDRADRRVLATRSERRCAGSSGCPGSSRPWSDEQLDGRALGSIRSPRARLLTVVGRGLQFADRLRRRR